MPDDNKYKITSIAQLFRVMFELKLQFLQDQNYSLRRQVSSLQQVLTAESNIQQKSVLYQMSQTNSCLTVELQTARDQLLLERQAREIEKAEHWQVVEELNRSILQLNKQISVLQDIVREEKRLEYQPSFFQKWFKNKMDSQRREICHTYADPVLFFQVLQGILEALSEKQQLDSCIDQAEYLEGSIHKTALETSSAGLASNKRKRQVMPDEQEILNKNEEGVRIEEKHNEEEGGEESKMKQRWSKWGEERSSIYFLKRKKVKDLHLNLSTAKLVQKSYISAQESKEGIKPVLATDVQLLKKSYVQLIGEHQILSRKMRLIERYAEELENRNRILLRARIEAPLEV